MERTTYLPDADRLSILSAAILLAYAASRFVEIPARELGLQLPGFYLAVELNIHTVVALLVAGLTATGADLLLRDHPALGEKRTVEHWLLPALTAWTLGIPLNQMPVGLQWLISFAIAGFVIMLVLVSEYIAVDPEDERYPIASAALTAVAYALFLILAIVLQSAGFRLFLILPALLLAAGLVSLRTLHLRLKGRWLYLRTLVIVVILTGMISAFHYWPLSPITYGLLILGPAYSLTSLIGALSEGQPLKRAIIEPTVVLMVVWGAAVWVA
ncbi:MAG: hypothetical protein JSV69_02100 [Chloroflexota bacterium]|nr:MAG: hypothetical protein JSV69_02100 [Chloroflexota bacterium]